MGRFWSFIVVGAVHLAIIPPASEAQRSRSIGIQHERIAHDPGTLALETGNPSASKYVATGALVGGLIAAVGIGIYFAQSDSEFLGNPVALAPLVVGSAALGAGVGYLAYRARMSGVSELRTFREQAPVGIPPEARDKLQFPSQRNTR